MFILYLHNETEWKSKREIEMLSTLEQVQVIPVIQWRYQSLEYLQKKKSSCFCVIIYVNNKQFLMLIIGD